jgi:hypothetical protein
MYKEKRVQKKYGWHVLNGERMLRDKRVVEDGEWVHARRRYRPKQAGRAMWRVCTRTLPRACRFGMHACSKLRDAMGYGYILHNTKYVWMCRVLVEDEITSSRDKFVGRKRKILWSVCIGRYKTYRKRFRALRNAVRKAYKKKYGKDLKMELTR